MESVTLCKYDLEICYWPGRVNSNVDALSRAPVGGGEVPSETTEVQVAQVSAASEVMQQPPSELRELQLACKEVGPMLLYVQEGMVPESGIIKCCVDRVFQLLEGVLYYVDPSVKLRQKLLKEVHGGAFAGHFAVKGTYEKLNHRYWWNGMYADVYAFCKGCLVCSAYGGGGKKTRPPLKSIPVGDPFERVGVDLMEMPLTERGNRYVIVFLDYLTKWVEAYPLSEQTSKTIARVLVDMVICRHGVPQQLLSDRGATLLSVVMREVCEVTGMEKVNTTAYHPQMDSLVENFNRTLKSMLAKHCKEFGPQWDVHMQQLLFAYRTKPHEFTRESPFYLLYGRDARLPTANVLDTPLSPYTVDLDDYKVELTRGLASAWKVAMSEVSKAQVRQKRGYDRKAKSRNYQEGGRVMVFMPAETTGKNRKLSLPYYGLYRILEAGTNTVLVRPVDKPAEQAIRINMERAVPCPKELPDQLWLGAKAERRRQRRSPLSGSR